MIEQQQIQSWQWEDSENTQTNSQIIIGYYNLRGKAQVPRLLLEYLRVPYTNKFYSIYSWQQQVPMLPSQFIFPVLPYLKEGRFVVTDSVAMCCYIINRFGNSQLLGKNLKDRAIIQMYFWTIPYMETVISINTQQKSEEQMKKFKSQQWKCHVFPRLKRLQDFCSENWFMGYLTIIDFSIYELVRYMENIFEKIINDIPKLKQIERNFSQLQQIKQYEISEKAVIQWCPTKLLEQFKAMNKKNQTQ